MIPLSFSSLSSCYSRRVACAGMLLLLMLQHDADAFLVGKQAHGARAADVESYARRYPSTEMQKSLSPLYAVTGAVNTTADSDGAELSSSLSVAEAKSYLSQARALREQAQVIRHNLDMEAEQRKARELERVDRWIHETLFLNTTASESDVELLYSVEQVTQFLQDRRMSEEHVMRMFRRLSESNAAARSRCSPLVELLVQAAGRMDVMERDEQPNKRWSGKVERKLRRRLFANDWNIDLDELEEKERNGGDRD